MRRVGASFMAMTAGWAVMNAGVFVVSLIITDTGLPGLLREMLVWVVATGMVVGAAWLVVYLPVYCLVPRSWRFWNWGICVPAGAMVGAIVPFGLWVIPMAAAEGEWGALWVLLMPAVVGGVAAAVGRYLVDWSRYYREAGPGPELGGVRA